MIRLKRSIELVEAADGDLLLLRPGLPEFRIRAPRPAEEALLHALDGAAQDRSTLTSRLSSAFPDDPASKDLDANLDQLMELGVLEDLGLFSSAQLTDLDCERFDRQMLYFADVASGSDPYALQAKLRASVVVILGVGGLGSWAASGIACLGVGRLVLVDDDTVSLSNLNRQILFEHTHIGRRKVDSAAERLRRFDDRLEVVTAERRVRSVSDVAEVIEGADVVVETADWPPHEITRITDQACRDAGIPRISAGQFPPYIRVGPWTDPRSSPCFACQEQELRRTHRDYDVVADRRKRTPVAAATLGPASGMIGSIIAHEVLGYLTGLHTPATLDRRVVVDMRTMTTSRQSVGPPSCSRCLHRSSNISKVGTAAVQRDEREASRPA